MRSISKHEGERAVTFGWIEQWEKLESGETKVLLTQVSVRGHDRRWEEKLDHLWVYTPSDWWDRSDLKRLDSTAFCGTVFQYRRANGTIDYGVKRDFWATPWSKYAGHCMGSDRISWEKRKQILDEAVIYNDFYRDYPETFSMFQRELSLERKRVELNLKALETSKGCGFSSKPELEIKARRSEAKGFC